MTKFLPQGYNLFDWASDRERNLHQSPAANYVQRHFHLSPERSRLVANLSGLGGRDE